MNKTLQDERLVTSLLEAAKFFHERGWSLGTSGNFSVVLGGTPLRLAVTSSGVNKAMLSLEQMVEIDERGEKIGTSLETPSSEGLAHVAIVQAARAGAVIHTHSVSSTHVSEIFAADKGLFIQGYEMLKGLEGVKTHGHQEWIPILENQQDMKALGAQIKHTLAKHPKVHGILLRRHGLYTWGKTLKDARRHVEVFEFLLEVISRLKQNKRV